MIIIFFILEVRLGSGEGYESKEHHATVKQTRLTTRTDLPEDSLVR